MNDPTKTDIGLLNPLDLTTVPGPAASLATTGTDEDTSPTGDFANSFTDTTNPFGQLNVNGSATGFTEFGDHDLLACSRGGQ